MNKLEKLFLNNIGLIFFVGYMVTWLSPMDIEHGYKLNYDIIFTLIFTIVYYTYCWMYTKHMVKGTFVVSK